MTMHTNKAKKVLIFLFLFATLFSMLSADFAEARRLGGGRSFGQRKSYQKPAQKPSPSRDSKTTQQSGTTQKRPGGMGGMLGGLLVGSMLGGLLFGGGMGGGNILDLLLIGGGLFLLMRLLRSRRPLARTAGGYGTGSGAAPPRDTSGHSARTFQKTDKTTSGGWSGLNTPPPPPQNPAEEESVPADFDEAEFLEGAKVVYHRLQESWDKRDLEDIRTFVAPEVYREIAEQASQDPNPGKTEILMLEARLLEVKQLDGETLATVFYDALLREDSGKDTPDQVREVWHFSRPSSDEQWLLAGIQQLED